MNRLLLSSRYLVNLAVVAALVGAVAILVYGVIVLVHLIIELIYARNFTGKAIKTILWVSFS